MFLADTGRDEQRKGDWAVDRVYLYAITDRPSSDEVDLGVLGLDGASPVRLVAREGVGCVVSDYPGREMRHLSREELVRCLLLHQRVVERVMPYHTVLPVKFGTTVEDDKAVGALLGQGHQALTEALNGMRDKVEVEVAATWDVNQALEAASWEEEVVRAREAIARKGSPTLEDRVHLGQVVKACLDRRRDDCRKRMLGFLHPLAISVAPNALISEDMVMNVAFLVNHSQQRRFDEGVQELDTLFQNEITFRVIGPLPPYSFSTVEVSCLTGQEIEEARRALGLTGDLSHSRIRQAYRRLAAQEQRKDGCAGRASGESMARWRRASEALLACPDAALAGDSLFAVSIRGTGYQNVEAARFGAAMGV
ncbi:MAG: GvpL/GvpF-family gas vesicle protein 2 [Dehalococcoidia bacterium]|nr:GvpL/GvpF-family gas vesicle protein 2 [Dehalococcoidia bacterium]